jgi:hypothetical protein
LARKASQSAAFCGLSRALAAATWVTATWITPRLIRKKNNACSASADTKSPWPCEPKRNAIATVDAS